MAEKVPSWFELRGSDFYQNLPPEGRLRAFDGWQGMKEEELLTQGVSTSQALRFYAANDALRGEIEQGKEGQTDIGEALENAKERRRTERDYAGQKARQALFTDRAIRKHLRGEKPDESGAYQFPQGLNLPLRRSVGDRELSWLQSITDPNKAPSGDFQWETRVLQDSDDETGDSRSFEVNPALTLLGFDAFRDAVMEGEGTTREKITAIANFDVYRKVIFTDLEDYILSKKVRVDSMGMGSHMAGAGARPSPQEIARMSASKRYADDDEDGEIDYTTSMFLTKPDLFKIREGQKEIPSGEQLASEVAQYYLKKRGLGEIAAEVGNNPELVAQLSNAYRDTLLDNPDVWAEDVMTVKDSDGNIIPNPKLITEGSPEKITTALEEAGASEEKIAASVAAAAELQEADAAQLIESLLSGVEERDGAGTAFAVSETIMRTQAQDFRNFFDLNKDKGWSAKEMIDAYGDYTRDPGFEGLVSRLKYNKSPLGWLGVILQSWNDKDQDGGFGNAAEGVGSFLRNLEEVALQGPGKLGLGIYAFTAGGIEKGVDKLGGDINLGAERMRERRQAIGDVLSTSDAIYGRSGRWSRMIGEELAIIGLTMGASAPASVLRQGGTKMMTSLQGSRMGGAVKVFENTSDLVGKHMRRFSIDRTLQAGTTGGEALGNAFARRAYFGLQASRSAEATYSESYDKWYDQAILSGLTPEQAKSQAEGRAFVSGVGAGLITGTMMKLIPGGTERLFEKGSKMTMRQLSAELGITKEMLARAVQNPRFMKEAGEMLVKEFGIVGREGLKEAVEEFSDEFAQGILAQSTYDPDRPFKDIIHGAFEAAAVGGLLGSAVTARTVSKQPVELDAAAMSKIDDLRSLAKKISRDLPDTARKLYTEAEKKESKLRGETEEQSPRTEDGLVEPVEGDEIHFITNGGRQGQGVWHQNQVFEPVGEQDLLEGIEEEADTVELGGVKMVPVGEDLANMAGTAEGLGAKEENPLVTDTRREYEERMQEIKENESLTDEQKAKELASVYEEAQQDSLLKGTDSLIVFEAHYKPMVDRYSKKSDTVSSSGTAQIDSMVTEYETTERDIQQGIVNGDIPADQGDKARMRSREGIHAQIEENWGKDPLLTETLKTATDLAFAALNVTRASYRSSGEIEGTGKSSATIADNRNAKRVAEFMDEMETISARIAEGKASPATLAKRVKKFYDWAAGNLKKNSETKTTEMIAAIESGDPVMSRLSGYILQGDPLSKTPLKLPSLRLDDMAAPDNSSTTYLHNILERNNMTELSPEEDAELAAEIAANEEAEQAEVLSPEEEEAMIFLGELFEEIHVGRDSSEVVDLDDFLKAAAERKLTQDAGLIEDAYYNGVARRFEPGLVNEAESEFAPDTDQDSEAESAPEEGTGEDSSDSQETLERPEATVKSIASLATYIQDQNTDEVLKFPEFVEQLQQEENIDNMGSVEVWRAYQKGIRQSYKNAFEELDALVEEEILSKKDASEIVDNIKEQGLPVEDNMGKDLLAAGLTEKEETPAGNTPEEEDTPVSTTPDVVVSPTEDVEETSEIIAREDESETLPEAEENSEVVDVEAVEATDPTPKPPKRKESKPNPDAYTVEEMEKKKAELAKERAGAAEGVFVTPSDFTKKGRPLRKNRLRKHEQEAADEINKELIEKYPLAPEGSTVTLSAPSGRLRSIRNRQPKRVDVSSEAEPAEQLEAARRYARPNGFSNSPFHMAVELSEDNAQPVPVPEFFLANPDKINPGLILNKAGTHVIGARTSFKDANGKFETVMLAEEGGTARTLYEIADKNVDESLREKNKRAAQQQAMRQKEVTSGAVETFSKTSAEVFSNEERQWLKESDLLDLPIIISRQILSQFKGKAGDAFTEIQNRILGKAALSILKTRIARAVEDVSDATAVNEYFQNHYVNNFTGKPEADVKGFKLLVDAYLGGDASKLFGSDSHAHYRLIDPNIQVEGESHWDSINGLLATERATPGKRNKGQNNPNTQGPEFVSYDNAGEEAVSRAINGEVANEEGNFYDPTRISVETEAEFTPEEREVMEKVDEELREENPDLFDQEGGAIDPTTDDYDPSEENMTLPSKAPKLTAERREVRRRIRQEIRELGLEEGDSDSLRTALLNIKEGAKSGKYPKQYGEVADMLLMSDQLDLSVVELQIKSEEKAAGLFWAGAEGEPNTVVISDTVSNPRGHHDVVVHELIHAALDNLVTNPVTERQKQTVKAIDAFIDRSRQHLDKLENSRANIDQWMRLVALREAENYSLERIDMMLATHKSPLAKEWRADMDENQKRELFKRVREEDRGVVASYNEILQTRYALGVRADGSYMDQEYTRREFVTHILTDEHFRWYLKQVDSQTKGGSILTKALRVKWWGLTGQPATNANAALLESIMTFEDGNSPFKDARHQKTVNMLAGLTPEQKQDAADFRETTPAYQGSMPSASFLKKNAKAPEVDHKSLGLRKRNFTGGYGAWVLPNGQVIEVMESHQETAEEAGMKGELTAMKAGWVRLNIVDGAALYSGRPNIPRKARATIEDWADFNGTWAEYDADQFRDASDDPDSWQFSLPAETASEAAVWARVGENSPARLAYRMMGASIQPRDDVAEPTVGGNATVYVPSQGDIDETPLTESIVRASFSNAFAPGARAQAHRELTQFPEMSPEVEKAGSYDKLVSSMVTEAMTGESTHTGNDVGLMRRQILSGAYGPVAQSQLNTVLRAAENAFPEGTRSFQREAGQDEIYFVGNRVMAERAKHELGLELVGNDELSFYEEMADVAGDSLPNFMEDTFSENPEIGREVQASIAFRRQESSKMADLVTDEGIAASLNDYLAERKSQASLPAWMSRDAWRAKKDPSLKGKLVDDTGRDVIEVLNELEIPTIEALRKRGVKVDRLKQMFTVEGRMGKKAHAMHMELKGKISALREETLFHDDKVRSILNDKLGSRSIDELLNSTDPLVRKHAEQVNLVLGTVHDEDIVDEMFPGNSHLPGGLTRRQQLFADKEKSIRVHKSRLGKEYARAARLEKRNQPGDIQAASAIRARAKEDMRTNTRVINDAYWKDLTNLTKLASTKFRSKQQAAGAALVQFDRDLFRAVNEMRNSIDRMQREVLNSPILDRAGGADTALLRNLKVKIGSTQGIYLSTSYQGLDEKGWANFLETFHPEAQSRMQDAYQYFREELTKSEAKTLMKNDPNLTEGRARALIASTGKVTSDMVVAKVKDFLTNTLKVDRGAPGMAMGQLNTKVLTPRKEIPKELRNLAGQYNDNVYNASQTLLRLGSMMANENFLQGVHDTLAEAQADAVKRKSKAKFLSDRPEPGLMAFVDETAGRMGGAESYGPLAHKFGPPELVKALHDMSPSNMATAHRALLTYSSFTMGNMTTRRLRTHVRNFLGNPMFLVNAGMPLTAMTHLGGAIVSGGTFGPGGHMMRNFFRGGKVEGVKDAVLQNPLVPQSIKDLLPEEGETFSEQALSLLKEYAAQNITGTDVHVNQRKEIHRELQNAGMADPAFGFFSPNITPGTIPFHVKKGIKGGDAALTEFYQMGDDWWKVVAYENQLEALARSFDLVDFHKGRLIGKALAPSELRARLGDVDKDGVYRGPMTEAQADRILDEIGLKKFGLTTGFSQVTDAEKAVSTPEQKALLKKDKRAAALEALRRAAAYRVRKTMPNYGATIEAIRSLKKHGITAMGAPFISFRAEIARIFFDTPVLAMREIRSKNSGVKLMGWKRLLGSAFTMTASPYAATFMAKLLYGLVDGMLGEDDDEASVAISNDGAFSVEEDVKRFISKYFKDGTIAVLDQAADGTVTWMDMSYMLPHSVVVDPATSFLKSFFDPTKDPLTEIQRSSKALAAPYVAPQLWMSALSEGTKDSNSLTGQIEPHPLVTLAKNGWRPIRDISLPGTFTDWGKLASAALAGGQTYKNGRKISVEQELISQLLGTKIVQTDMADRFQSNLSKWNATRAEAQQKFTSPVGNQTTFSEKDLDRLMDTATELDRIAVREARRDYLAARSRLPQGMADQLLRDSGISKEFKAMIVTGVYTPWTPSKGAIERAFKASEAIKNPGRVDFMIKKSLERRKQVEILYPDLEDE